MRALLPLLLCCISLWSLQQQQQQILAAPLGHEESRSSFTESPNELEEGENITPESTPSPMDALPGPLLKNGNTLKWKLRLLARTPKGRLGAGSGSGASPAQTDADMEHKRKASRGRRHAGLRSHHRPQLMRVGCSFGTCQVQNLSHRLYQLIGQSGREDTSPIKPDSPHSYGSSCCT